MFFMLLLYGHQSMAQLSKEIDSLHEELLLASDDQKKFDLIYKLSQKYRKPSPTLAIQYARAADSLARKLNDPARQAKSSSQTGFIYVDLLEYDSALVWYQKSLRIRDNHELSGIGLAILYSRMGIVYRNMARYSLAMEAYEHSLEIRQELDDPQRIAIIYENMAILQYEWAQTLRLFASNEIERLPQETLALYNYQKSLRIWQKEEIKEDQARITNNMVPIFLEWGEYDSALMYVQISLRLNQELPNPSGLADATSHLGLVYMELGEKEKALSLFQEAFEIRKKSARLEDILVSHNNLGLAYTRVGEYQLAEFHLDRARFLVDSSNIRNRLAVDCYEILAEYYFATNQYQLQTHYLQLYHDHKDRLLYQQTTQEIASVTDRWTQQKLREEAAQAHLERMLAQRRARFMIGIGIGGIGLFLFFVIFQSKRQEHKRNQLIREKVTEIKQLEREYLHRQIDAKEILLKNVGRDLHDKLSSDLSSCLISMGTLKKGINDWSERGEQSFEIIDQQLQQAYDFVRRISHDIDGWSVQESHLLSHIHDLCKVLETHGIEVHIYDFGIRLVELPPLVKQGVARIVQEAITNILKHAAAREVVIELRHEREKEHLLVKIEDDGKGFDKEETKGFGLSSIQSRVEDLKGSFQLETSPGQGASLTILLPV